MHIPGKGSEIFFSPLLCPDRLWHTQPSTQWFLEVLIPRVKRPGRKADNTSIQSRG
jgi:hypothetical protein